MVPKLSNSIQLSNSRASVGVVDDIENKDQVIKVNLKKCVSLKEIENVLEDFRPSTIKNKHTGFHEGNHIDIQTLAEIFKEAGWVIDLKVLAELRGSELSGYLAEHFPNLKGNISFIKNPADNIDGNLCYDVEYGVF